MTLMQFPSLLFADPSIGFRFEGREISCTYRVKSQAPLDHERYYIKGHKLKSKTNYIFKRKQNNNKGLSLKESEIDFKASIGHHTQCNEIKLIVFIHYQNSLKNEDHKKEHWIWTGPLPLFWKAG